MRMAAAMMRVHFCCRGPVLPLTSVSPQRGKEQAPLDRRDQRGSQQNQPPSPHPAGLFLSSPSQVGGTGAGTRLLTLPSLGVGWGGGEWELLPTPSPFLSSLISPKAHTDSLGHPEVLLAGSGQTRPSFQPLEKMSQVKGKQTRRKASQCVPRGVVTPTLQPSRKKPKPAGKVRVGLEGSRFPFSPSFLHTRNASQSLAQAALACDLTTANPPLPLSAALIYGLRCG